MISRPGRFLAALGQVFLDDLLEVVDVVKGRLVEAVDIRVDVARTAMSMKNIVCACAP
jgi:hypothetical protein